MTTPTEVNRRNLNAIMNWLATFRQKTVSLPDQDRIGPVLEAVEVYQHELGNFTGSELIRWSAMAVYDVEHEMACAKYGYDSAEAADAAAAIDSCEREFSDNGRANAGH